MKVPMVRVFGLGGSILVGGLSVWLSSGFHSEPRAEPKAGGMTINDGAITLTPDAPQWKALKLGVVTSADTRWTDPIPGRIAIDETRASKMQTPLSGRISREFVELGQRVTQGDPLFSVQSADIADLRAAKEKAAVDLDVAKVNADRVHALVAARALPAKEEVLSQQQLKEAELTARAAAAKVEALRVSENGDNEFTVVAPRSGVVVEKNVLVGQEVSPDASALLVVADLSSVWVLADVFESDATEVREGTTAQITSPSMPGLETQGRVDMVSAVADPQRHTVPVRVRLANPGGTLRPNIYARVRFATAGGGGTAEIAAGALVTDGSKQYVYVRDAQGRFTKRPIVAGPARDGRVPVLSGLTPGETIVDEGALLLDNQVDLGA